MAEEKSSTDGESDLYWVRAGSESTGIVVAITWMLCKPRNFGKHSRLYASCNWDSLISHPKLFNLWFPPLANSLAIRILDVLTEELHKRPRPVVFATFSGGLKTALYKIFQMLDGSCSEDDFSLKKYRAVRDCYAGQIHDSSPVDFLSRNGADFITHPVVRGTSKPNAALSWSAHAMAKTLDFFFLPRWEAQRHDMWSTLNKSGAWGPVLVFCSKDDKLASWEVIQNFCSHLSSLGCKVKLVEWEESGHVAHYKNHPDEYTAAIKSFFSDVAASFAIGQTPDSDHGFASADGGGQLVKGSISGSATSGWSLSRGKAVPQNQLSVSLQSETSSDGVTRFWIPSKL